MTFRMTAETPNFYAVANEKKVKVILYLPTP
jgi:hypothetical protein